MGTAESPYPVHVKIFIYPRQLRMIANVHGGLPNVHPNIGDFPELYDDLVLMKKEGVKKAVF
jgi:hypothetical protein